MTNTETTPTVLSEAELLDFLRSAIEACGGIGAVARSSTLNKSNISKAVRGKRRPGPMLLKALGIREERVYVLPERWVQWLDSRAETENW